MTTKQFWSNTNTVSVSEMQHDFMISLNFIYAHRFHVSMIAKRAVDVMNFTEIVPAWLNIYVNVRNKQSFISHAL